MAKRKKSNGPKVAVVKRKPAEKTPYDAFEKLGTARRQAKQWARECGGGVSIYKIPDAGRLKYEIWISPQCARKL